MLIDAPFKAEIHWPTRADTTTQRNAISTVSVGVRDRRANMSGRSLTASRWPNVGSCGLMFSRRCSVAYMPPLPGALSTTKSGSLPGSLASASSCPCSTSSSSSKGGTGPLWLVVSSRGLLLLPFLEGLQGPRGPLAGHPAASTVDNGVVSGFWR